MRAKPSYVSIVLVIIVVSFAWIDLILRSTAAKRVSMLFLTGRHAIDDPELPGKTLMSQG